jgi:endonuclease-3
VKAKQSEFEKDIYSSGFYRAKAKNILAAAKYLKTHHSGVMPKTMAEMVKIPSVGRKTANVVLGNAYGIVEGIAVDTHVKRLAQVLGLTNEKTPEKIEKDLMVIFPKKEWFRLTYLLIEYGRNYCVARPHNHTKCPLFEFSKIN